MAEGNFTLEQLQVFAKAYWHHVKVFRLYLAGAMTAVTEEESLQITLTSILADEYGLFPQDGAASDPTFQSGVAVPPLSHPSLFRKFMRSLGLQDDDWLDPA